MGDSRHCQPESGGLGAAGPVRGSYSWLSFIFSFTFSDCFCFNTASFGGRCRLSGALAGQQPDMTMTNRRGWGIGNRIIAWLVSETKITTARMGWLGNGWAG